MQPLPVTDVRTNLGTWAVAGPLLPAAGAALVGALPAEAFDPDFRGQRLRTTYLDTPQFLLRKARVKGDRYLTLRVRHYHPAGLFALSAKTEGAKVRVEVEPAVARAILGGDRDALEAHLPADVVARLAELVHDSPPLPVVEVCCHRFAREDGRQRLTLDTGICTDTGLCLPFNVLELKASEPAAPWPAFVADLGLRPVKVSKFLWATGGGR
ncbi:MAG TPA: VTC domain-containing protein [Gemmataceae bacterium]|nr:VTC domain-containing protein [Gemmataceae bacterium]